MRRRCGIDTSILVRLLVAEPEKEFQRCVAELRSLIESGKAEILASNQVIGEAYIAVQNHYGVGKKEARTALSHVLQSGLVAPLHGKPVLDALAVTGRPGLFDRLIALDYGTAGVEVLTLDRKMSSLTDVSLLFPTTG